MPLVSKSKNKQRGPPPVLFLPPSPGASHVTLPGILAPGATGQSIYGLKRENTNADISSSPRSGVAVSPEQQRPSRTLQAAGSSRGTERTDALWAEMQASLEQVELSASEGTHVFGPAHDQRLVELRAAQIDLAQAWARSEADDAIETGIRDHTTSTTGDELSNLKGALPDPSKSVGGDGTDAAKSATGTSARPGSGGGEVDRLGAKLEEETEVDILLARKRREANDEYFQRVNHGVIDVVAKLESVAVAMRAAEQETQDLWQENSSLPESNRV